MIPEFNDQGNLPPGIHPATWSDVLDRFGNTPYRRGLTAGLKEAALALKAAGCQRLYLNGSFTSAKKIPRDYDACWDTAGVNLTLVDPVLKIFADGRAAQKARFRGELFPAGSRADVSGRTYLHFFQRDQQTGKAKGIILLDLGSLT